MALELGANGAENQLDTVWGIARAGYGTEGWISNIRMFAEKVKNKHH